MRLLDVRIPTADLAALRSFYGETLGLPVVAEGAGSFTVRAGTTRLTFAEGVGAGATPPQHVAFTIPRNRLAGAKGWLARRAALLTQDGADEFASAGWRVQMVYFRDPAGNILELIARQTLANGATAPFDAGQMLNLSEVGLPTGDVPGTVAALGREFGLSVYGEPSETFTAVGNAEGLLIVVRAGRHWFPTTIPAVAVPLEVRIAGAGGECRGEWVVRGAG